MSLYTFQMTQYITSQWMISTLKPIPVASIIRARCMRYSVPIVWLFLWADPVTWAKIKIKIKIEVKLKSKFKSMRIYAYIWLTYRWLLKVTNAHASKTDTHMHRRQTRSSSVTVSACTVPDCQTWSVYPRNGAGANQSNESSTRYTRTYAFLIHFLCLNLPRMGGFQPIK